MPSKLEQLQLQFRQRLKEERLIKIHTDNQQKALSQVSKYSHTATAQSTVAPAAKPQPAISIPHQPQPHHSPIKKGSPGVDRSRPLPPIAKEQQMRNQSNSSSSSPINGTSEYATKTTPIQNARSKYVDLEARYNPVRSAQNGPAQNGRMPARNDPAHNGRMPPSVSESVQNSRMPPRNDSINYRMPPSRSDSVQNGKVPLKNGYNGGGGKTVTSESKPYQEVPFERKPDQELLNKMKQAELQRLKVNSKIREDTSPRNGFNGAVSKSSMEPRKTTKPPSPAPAPTRPKPRTQAVSTPRRPGPQQPAASSKPNPRGGDPPRKPPGSGQEQCAICGRNFNRDRIEKHLTICKKAASKKVKVFDATKMRTKGTEAEQFVRKGVPKSEPKSSKKSDWRKKHNEFIEAIRQAKMVQQHLAKGGKVSDLPPPKPSDNSDYVQCPHCSRRFSEGVAERHIPKCKNILCNKKNPPPATTTRRR